MRIHTDLIEQEHLNSAVAGLDGVRVEASRHGSRKRDHAFSATLSAEPRQGRRRRNTGQYGIGDDYAATWDEWGVFLSWLFSYDPNATCDYYDGKEHFHWATGNRFGNVVALDMHDRHRFTLSTPPDTSPDRRPYVVHECACGATRRVLVSATWEQVRQEVSA